VIAARRIALILLLAACATRDSPVAEPNAYIHEPTGLSFPLYLGEMVRGTPTTENPYIPGSVGVGYHHQGAPSLFVTLMPATAGPDSDPAKLLTAILHVEDLRGIDSPLVGSGTVDATCYGEATPFSYIVTSGPTGPEVRFSTRFRGYLVYLRGLRYSNNELLSPLLAGVLSNLGFPCTVAATE